MAAACDSERLMVGTLLDSPRRVSPAEAYRDRAVEDDPAAVRVSEAQARGVQADAAERVVSTAVRAIADDRMAGRGELGANLSTPSGRQRELEQRGVGPSREHAVLGDRLA